jgi:hypothetical protein
MRLVAESSIQQKMFICVAEDSAIGQAPLYACSGSMASMLSGQAGLRDAWSRYFWWVRASIPEYELIIGTKVHGL